MGEFMKDKNSKNNKSSKRIRLLPSIVKGLIILFLIYLQANVIYLQISGSGIVSNLVSFTILFMEIFLVTNIICKLQNSEYKLIWITMAIFFPVPTLLLYIILGNTKIPKVFQMKIDKEYIKSDQYIRFDHRIHNEVKDIDKLRYNQVNYLFKTTGFPIYKSSNIEYFETGGEYFESMIEDISKAKNYILLEYYSIGEGILWNRLFDVLKQKVAEGIEVYVITDDVGNIGKYPKKFKENLKKARIEYKIFNPLNININRYLNYRDHRKMTVIDSDIVYTGGLNIGDPYINVYKKFGHLKDTGIKVIGEAAQSYTIMFIRTWNLSGGKKELEYEKFLNKFKVNKLENEKKYSGYIMPYCDGPDNSSNPAQNIYIQTINAAKNYIYITTPYLILAKELITALINSSKSGVDVRIITPYIPDKPFVHLIVRAFYNQLLEAGIKIYEYKPGFIHSKMCVIDNDFSILGTANFDFRGLYMHYECANWIYKTGIEILIKEDFLRTQRESIEIELKEWTKRGKIKEIIDKVLITLAPLF